MADLAQVIGPTVGAGGLGNADAALRLARDGPNELPVSKPRSVLKLLREVASEPMFLLLVGEFAM